MLRQWGLKIIFSTKKLKILDRRRKIFNIYY